MNNINFEDEKKFVGAICGGGYTDKYGVTWDLTGRWPNCKYSPRICKECQSFEPMDPPPLDQRWTSEVGR